MTIIKIEAIGGKHDIQYQSHRTECWEGGYIEVPRELEIAVNASCGYCDLTITDGVLTAITPTERPVVPVPVPKPTAEEQMRADIDYLAAMQGVTL